MWSGPPHSALRIPQSALIMSPNDAHFLTHAFLRLLLAAGLGAAVGAEREFKHKPAGLRTMMLIAMGSALFTILSEGLASVRGGDPQRIAAQLIPGIGFLGAGAIIQSAAAVTGLTTAATIFAMASIGMAAGGGMSILACFASALMLLVLVVLGWIEGRAESKVRLMSFSITTTQPSRCLLDLQQMAAERNLAVKDFRVRKAGDQCTVDFDVETPSGAEAMVLQRIEELERCSQ